MATTQREIIIMQTRGWQSILKMDLEYPENREDDYKISEQILETFKGGSQFWDEEFENAKDYLPNKFAPLAAMTVDQVSKQQYPEGYTVIIVPEHWLKHWL
jgi:hypothetical protein